MIDLVTLLLKAGDGGYGRVSFRREKFVQKGGPDGGDGGDGGSIILRAKKGLRTLQHLSGVKSIEAKPGVPGGKRRKIGGKGESVTIEVPVGTTVWLIEENAISARRRLSQGIEGKLRSGDVRNQLYFVEKEGQSTGSMPVDELAPLASNSHPQGEDESEQEKKTTLSEKFREGFKQELYSLTEDGQEVLLCQGGFGGRGNEAFKGSERTTPMQAEHGTPGEQKLVYLEVKLLADVGVIGLPNAGKSTLLSRLTQARPKIAAYPFTTLEPHLGVLHAAGRDLVMADIPGLIEGAHQGRGLGFSFLRHAENCRVLVIVVALEDMMAVDESISLESKLQELVRRYEIVLQELLAYDKSLGKKPAFLVVNKLDLWPAEQAAELLTRLTKQWSSEAHHLLPVVGISSQTGQGTAELLQHISKYFETL
jgi:GTP-binding protein